MADYSGQTVSASSVTNDGSYTTLTLPYDGYYNTNSKISCLNSELSVKKITPVFERSVAHNRNIDFCN